MSDLISREYLVEHIHACMENDRLMKTATKEEILQMIADMPSARPIGKWELQEEDVENIYLCSNCRNYKAWGETEKTPYCPHHEDGSLKWTWLECERCGRKTNAYCYEHQATDMWDADKVEV